MFSDCSGALEIKVTSQYGEKSFHSPTFIEEFIPTKSVIRQNHSVSQIFSDRGFLTTRKKPQETFPLKHIEISHGEPIGGFWMVWFFAGTHRACGILQRLSGVGRWGNPESWGREARCHVRQGRYGKVRWILFQLFFFDVLFHASVNLWILNWRNFRKMLHIYIHCFL